MQRFNVAAAAFLMMAVTCHGQTIDWDSSTLTLVAAGGTYGRMVRLSNGDLLVSAQTSMAQHSSSYVWRSTDNGETWGSAVLAASYEYGYAANPQLLVLNDGNILLSYNARPETDGQGHPYKIMTTVSEDNGATWNSPVTVYTADDEYQNGCWEPDAIQPMNHGIFHPIRLYFANENDYPTTDEQEISVAYSYDGGQNWTDAETVLYEAGYRPGMPAAMQTQSGHIRVAIETDEYPSGYDLMIIDDDQEDGDTWLALDPELPTGAGIVNNVGAPDMVQFCTGETLVTCILNETSATDKHMAVFLGDSNAENFDGANMMDPFDGIMDSGTIGRFPSLFIKDVDTVTAMLSMYHDDTYGLWTIDGKLSYEEESRSAPSYLGGDANRDTFVDERDAGILAANWLKTGAFWSDGDFNYDGIVNGQDATIMAANWSPNQIAVPEPLGLVLLGLLGLSALLLNTKVTIMKRFFLLIAIVSTLAMPSMAKTIEWDSSTLTCAVSGGIWGRMARLPNGELMMCGQVSGAQHGPAYIWKSDDNGETWGSSVVAASYPDGHAANPSLLVMHNGDILLTYSARPDTEDDDNYYRIGYTISEDNGATWSSADYLYTASDVVADGCFQPIAIEPRDNLGNYYPARVYFTNANINGNTAHQIWMASSWNCGEDWTSPVPVAALSGYRYGCPAPLHLDSGHIRVALEHNIDPPGYDICMTDGQLYGDIWDPIDPSLPGGTGIINNAGAPYLAQFCTGETVLSCQLNEESGGDRRMVVFVGDSNADNFDGTDFTEPFDGFMDSGTEGLWNSLCIKDVNTVTAISTMTHNSQFGIWTIDGHLVDSAAATAAIPEPSSFVLSLILGLMCLGYDRTRRCRSPQRPC